jgi:transposase
MKKFIIGATAALIATVSIAASAEAGWKWKHGNNHGWKWKHGHHYGIKIYSPGYNDYCFVKKIKKYDDWGNVYIKKVRVCGY